MAFEEEPVWYMIERYLDNVEGVERTKEGFIVYDSFKIDYKGNAWVKQSDSFRADREGGTRDVFNSLCIVMQASHHSDKADKAFLPDESGNMVEVNSLTMTIIAKILFLLNPNMKDQVFTGQLSEELRVKLNSLRGGEQ